MKDDDYLDAKIDGVYDPDTREHMPLDQCVERGYMTQERYDPIIKAYLGDGWVRRDGDWEPI
ncbi:MAG: hypothetical protein LBG62_05365 [Candidatus Methanoplasma sp.]|jgi:hypothetical protein|nr:hypothetical protein [Candidatus Methanoplasma sp.]